MQLCRSVLSVFSFRLLPAAAKLHTIPGGNLRPRPPGLFGKEMYDEEDGGYSTAKLDGLFRSFSELNHGRQTEVCYKSVTLDP